MDDPSVDPGDSSRQTMFDGPGMEKFDFDNTISKLRHHPICFL
jgi:hypothetical protein